MTWIIIVAALVLLHPAEAPGLTAATTGGTGCIRTCTTPTVAAGTARSGYPAASGSRTPHME